MKASGTKRTAYLDRATSVDNLMGSMATSETVAHNVRRPQTVSELLLQIEGESVRSRTKPKTEVRNFARENVLRLREIQRICRQAEHTKKCAPVKPNQITDVQLSNLPKQSDLGRERNSTIPKYRPKEVKESNRTHQGMHSSGVTKGTSQQKTCEPDKERRRRTTSRSKDTSLQHNPPDCYDNSSIPQLPLNQSPTPLTASHRNEKPRQVETTATSLTPNGTIKNPQLRRSSSVPCIQTKNLKPCLELPEKYKLGTVPKYLQKRQKQWLLEAEKRKREAGDPNIPPGLELLPETERLETLNLLTKKHNELLKQIIMLPVAMDTLRIRQMKENLEREVVEVEEALKIFTQPKVYIKKDV